MQQVLPLPFTDYLSKHILLAEFFQEVLTNPQYEPLLLDAMEGIEAQHGFRDPETGTTWYFNVKKFDWYNAYGIEVEEAAFILDACGAVLSNSRLELYLIVLGGRVKINGEELPITNGYHLVVKEGKSAILRRNSSLVNPRYKLFKNERAS